MTEARSPQRDRQAFEMLCDEVDDYEPLPIIEAPDRRQGGGLEAEAQGRLDAEAQGRLDAEILSGLVSP